MSAFYRVNFDVSNNEDLRQSFQLTDEAGTAIDLTGATFEMSVANISGANVITATTANSKIVVTAAATGNFDVRIPVSDLSPLAEGAYPHDLTYTKAGVTKRIWTGTLTIQQGVA